MADAVRLGPEGLRRGWVLVGIWLGGYAVAAAIVLAIEVTPALLLNIAYPFVFVLSPLLVLLLRRRNDALVLGQEHLAIEGRAGPHRLAWDDVLEVGASKTSSGPLTWTPSLVVLVRPDGGAWNTPGPNMPLVVALPVFGRGPRDRAVEALRTACAEHGVPFDESGLRMAEQPRPGSSMRTDRTR